MATQGIARHTPAPCASLAWCGHAQHRRDVAKVERDVVLVDVVEQLPLAVMPGQAAMCSWAPAGPCMHSQAHH